MPNATAVPAKRSRKNVTRAATPPETVFSIPDAPLRPLRDVREFPLGFYQIIPGQKHLTKHEAKAAIKVFKKELLKYLMGDVRERPSMPLRPGVGAVDVVSRPQIVFKGERLVISSKIAKHFSIIDIKVGNRSQLANSMALPAQAFAENAIGVRLALDTAVVAQDIAIVVENMSPEDREFVAAIIGTAAQ